MKHLYEPFPATWLDTQTGTLFVLTITPILAPGHYWRPVADAPWKALGVVAWRVKQWVGTSGQYLRIEGTVR